MAIATTVVVPLQIAEGKLSQAQAKAEAEDRRRQFAIEVSICSSCGKSAQTFVARIRGTQNGTYVVADAALDDAQQAGVERSLLSTNRSLVCPEPVLAYHHRFP
jgi:hypothetical protein